MSDLPIIKYPRTPHLEGSRLQPGDEDMSQIPFLNIAGKPLVVEEKCDGANVAVSFDASGSLLTQSRGHYLLGGYREKHYDLFKQWAAAHSHALRSVLGARYIMYGEWLYAKHTVFYDALPHYFMEFDILDRETGRYLDTASRRGLLSGLPVMSAPVLHRGAVARLSELTALLKPSCFISPGHIDRLGAQCGRLGLSVQQIADQTDPTTLMEGLYIKVEQDGQVMERMKYVRASFLQSVTTSDAHWLERPIVPNLMKYPVDAIFAPQLPEE